MAKLPLILGILNTVAVAAVLGLFIFTKMIYKRPPITESQERVRLAKKEAKVETVQSLKKTIVPLTPMTVNLDPFIDPVSGKQKMHYVNMSLSVEIRDEKDVPKFEDIKPIVMDQVMVQLGKKKFEDLNQVQGRYLFRSQIIDACNAYLKDAIVTEVYFTDFLLQ